MAWAAGAPFSAAMQAAALTRHVPLPVIQATAYVNTRWEWITTPQVGGGVGPMSVSPSQMSEAASLSGRSPSQIKGDLSANLDAGAALLAHYHRTGTDIASWQTAVATVHGPYVARQIYDVLRSGAMRTTSTGETITLAPQVTAPYAANSSGVSTATTSNTDYPAATWVPADPSNYTVANRAHDYPIQLIVIHDIEGSTGFAIQLFQQPGYAASAHYIVSYQGQLTQMVREKDIAWHAGNWDYNTRAIGIEHEGFAWTPGLYTTDEYNASAALAASICSRWGVPMDRTHVIGHNEVPDPNNPGLFGGSDHHTDPGPYWDWTYYMSQAQADAAALPSPPHMMPDPVAVNGSTSATVTWQPARSCHLPISGYTVVGQPGGMTMNLPATASSASFSGLQVGTSYTFSVTAFDGDGQDTATSNAVIPGTCTSAADSASPTTPQQAGTMIQFSASANSCSNPQFEFWLMDPSGNWVMRQPYANSSTWTWDSRGYQPGTYTIHAWAKRTGSSTPSWEAIGEAIYTLSVPSPCSLASLSPANPIQPAGSTIAFTAGSTGCLYPEYEFFVQYPDGIWYLKQGWGGASFNWDTTGLAPGTYTLHGWVNARGTGYDAIGTATVTLTGCTSASLSPANPTQPAGSTIAFTVGSGGCPNPVYQFFIQYPDGTWNMKQGWGGATFSWDTTAVPAGTYTVHAWANQQGAAPTLEVYGSSTVTLTTCGSASLSPANPTQPAGSTIAFTVGSTGCVNPEYEFWVQYPDGSWNLKQGWGVASFNWDTTGLAPGAYTVHAWVNRTGTGYDAIGSAGVTLTGCTSASLSPYNPTQPAGSTIAFTASSGGCPNPVYQFFVQYPDGTWNLKQVWGLASFSWNTSGLAPGVYTVHAWVNNQGSSWDAYGSATVTLTGCTSAALSSATVGSNVTFTASSTGCLNPVYEFFLLDPSGTWHLAQGFGTTNSWTWNSASWANGTYTIHVWANQQGADLRTYETIGSSTFTLA